MWTGKAKTLRQWSELYARKRGEIPDIADGQEVIYLPRRGFMIYQVLPKTDTEPAMVYIHHTCGDGNFWLDVAEIIALSNNIDVLGTKCTVNIDAYLRGFGVKIISTQVAEDGVRRLVGRDCAGRKVLATQITNREALVENFFVTVYLKQGI